MQLSYKFLVEYGVIVPKPSHSRCFSIINFSVNVGVQAGVLGFNNHKIKKPEPPCCAGHNLRCAVRKVIPRIDQLVEKDNYIPLINSYLLRMFFLFTT